MSGETHRKWGVLTTEELAQRVAGVIDPAGTTEDAVERAQNIIRLVRENMTCIGNLDRGCY